MLTNRPDTLDSFNDADVDDYSTQDDGGESTEPENQGNTLYFGQQEEKDGEFMVNAMDVEELRRSQRRLVSCECGLWDLSRLILNLRKIVYFTMNWLLLCFNSGTEREEVVIMGVRRRRRMRSAAHPGNTTVCEDMMVR